MRANFFASSFVSLVDSKTKFIASYLEAHDSVRVRVESGGGCITWQPFVYHPLWAYGPKSIPNVIDAYVFRHDNEQMLNSAFGRDIQLKVRVAWRMSQLPFALTLIQW